MLPPGLSADLAPLFRRAELQQIHPAAKTVVQLLVGACSCDLIRPRLSDPIADERELRSRYRSMKLPRNQVIKELERHRKGSASRARTPTQWAEALAGFVAEHARNAGPSLYLLDFEPHGADRKALTAADSTSCSVREVLVPGSPWLLEGRPVVVG
jgi:hypothetical protein